MSEVSTPVATGSTGSLRLPRGEIPSTWRKPAEHVSTIPRRSPRPVASGALVGVGVVACVALAFALSPRVPQAARANPPVVVAQPRPIDAIPPPPPTSSTKPGAVAPEDQGGDLEVPAAAPPPTAATPPPIATASPAVAAPLAESELVGELPARKKAKTLTSKSIGMLREGDFAGAEPILVRAVLADPSYADGWRHLGIARAQIGDKDGARRAYKKYLALAPGAPDADQVKQILAAP